MTAGRPADTFSPFGNGLAAGTGPVYAIIAGPSAVTAATGFGGAANGWYSGKVLWFSRPNYRGSVVIRGAQIDGPHRLAFGDASSPTPSLSFAGVAADSTGWRALPSSVLVRARGCYAFRIDGAGFSTVIVFLALVDESPSAGARVVQGGCGSTVVYQGAPPPWLADAAGGSNAPGGVPYFSASSGLVGGFIFNYPLRVAGASKQGDKILWAVATPRNGPLAVLAQGPDGRTTTFSFPDDSSPGEIYPSIVSVPSPGCWSLSLRWATGEGQVQLDFTA